jgi:hypothetical protein
LRLQAAQHLDDDRGAKTMTKEHVGRPQNTAQCRNGIVGDGVHARQGRLVYAIHAPRRLVQRELRLRRPQWPPWCKNIGAAPGIGEAIDRDARAKGSRACEEYLVRAHHKAILILHSARSPATRRSREVHSKWACRGGIDSRTGLAFNRAWPTRKQNRAPKSARRCGQAGISTTLLLMPNRSLQGRPFSALHLHHRQRIKQRVARSVHGRGLGAQGAGVVGHRFRGREQFFARWLRTCAAQHLHG